MTDVLSRRNFLRGSVTAVAAVGVAARQQRASASGQNITSETVIQGVLASVDGSHAQVQSPDRRDYAVDTSEASEISRNGIATMSSFEIGDEVFAVGDWDGETFRATAFGLMYRFVEGAITARTNDRLDTTDGRLTLTPQTRRDEAPGMQNKEPSELGPGDQIAATGWKHPRTREFMVLRIGAVA